jgi:hypothetical protein
MKGDRAQMVAVGGSRIPKYKAADLLMDRSSSLLCCAAQLDLANLFAVRDLRVVGPHGLSKMTMGAALFGASFIFELADRKIGFWSRVGVTAASAP